MYCMCCNAYAIFKNIYASARLLEARGGGGGLFGLIITCLLEIRKKCFVKRKHGRQSSIPADPSAVALVIEVSLEIPLWPANVIASEQSP